MQKFCHIHEAGSDAARTAVTLPQLTETARFFRELAEHYKHIALHDALTGLENRHAAAVYIDHILTTVRNHHQQFGITDGFLIAMCDVDKFKSINDTLGHDAGDAALTEFSRRLEEGVRRRVDGAQAHRRHYDNYGIETDLVARYGGEEFLLMLPMQRYNRENAQNIARRIYHSVCGIYDLHENRAWAMTMSMGLHFVAWIEVEAFIKNFPAQENLDSKNTQLHKFLFDHADAAAYEAKNSGRARVCLWDKTAQQMDTLYTYGGPVSDAVLASRQYFA